MRHTKIFVAAAATVALTLAGGYAAAQRRPPVNNPDLAAAQQSLADAMRHIQVLRNQSVADDALDRGRVRAMAYIMLAQTELEGQGVRGLQLPGAD